MRKLRLTNQGFTVIEFLVFILALTAVGIVALSNIRTLRAQNRDLTNKTHLNSIYFQLESFYERSGFYPSAADKTTLPQIDANDLKDTKGLTINQPGSIYLYKPGGCTEAKCRNFELSTQLEREAPFIKQSLNK